MKMLGTSTVRAGILVSAVALLFSSNTGSAIAQEIEMDLPEGPVAEFVIPEPPTEPPLEPPTEPPPHCVPPPPVGGAYTPVCVEWSSIHHNTWRPSEFSWSEQVLIAYSWYLVYRTHRCLDEYGTFCAYMRWRPDGVNGCFPPEAEIALDYFIPGHTAGWRGDLQEAIRSYEAALRLQPDHYPSMFFLASRLDADKKYEQALGLWTGCIALRPT